MKIIERTQLVSIEEYEKVKKEFVGYFSKKSGVLSIYSFGGVSAPGVSDIDILLVVDKTFNIDFPEYLYQADSLANYLFTHTPFIIEDTNFNYAVENGHFSNLTLLYGQDFQQEKEKVSPLLFEAIASHFILRFSVFLFEMDSCGILKLRSFLLLARAIEFDYQILNKPHDGFEKMLKKIMMFRTTITNKSDQEIIFFYKKFKAEFLDWINRASTNFELHLPSSESPNYNGYKLVNHSSLSCKFINLSKLNGIMKFFLAKKSISLIRRINYGKTINIPIRIMTEKERSKYSELENLKKSTASSFPGYIPLIQILEF